MSDRKTGVYICSGCGIGEAVSTDQLAAVAGAFKPAHCAQHEFLCGDRGVAAIKADLDAGTVDQLVIAACSPRVNQDRFRFDGTQVVRANLREQVAWSQPAGAEDTQMLAADYVRMAIVEATKSTLPEAYDLGPYSRRILVVGGGVAGLTAAREAARTGYEVLLVERADRLGGFARGLSRRMPHRPPYRHPQENDIEALIAAVEADPRITIMTGARVARTDGAPGKFSVAVEHGGETTQEAIGAIVMATGWRPYDANRLGHLGYGASPDVVTGVEVEAMLANGGIKRASDGKTPRIVAFIQCAGSRDPDHLPYCSSVCCGVSIKQALQIREADADSSVYIIYDELRTPGTAEEFYRTAQNAGVIFMKGKVKSVGADLTVTVDDELLGEEVPLSGLDMVVLATGMVPNVTDIETTADSAAEPFPAPDIDPLAPIDVAGYAAGGPAVDPAPAIAAAGDQGSAQTETPPPGAPVLNLQYRQGPHLPNLADGFADSHFICFPYETRRTGIYACGPVRRPMDMAEAAEDATGAVLKAIQAIDNIAEGRGLHPRSGDLSFPRINLDSCTKCRRCTVECPFGAIDETEEDFPIVNASRCRRCGTCMGACPVRVISFDNYSVDMLTEMIKAVEVPDEFEEKPRVLIMACRNDAYPALDMAGINHSPISPYVRVLPVRCLGSINLLNIADALSAGFDGIMLMGCKSGDDYQCHFIKGSEILEERVGKVGETLKSMMLEEERVGSFEVSIADAGRVPQVIAEFMERIDEIGPNPFKGF